MTPKERVAIQQALEALEEIHVGNMTPMAEENWNKATAALREALAEQVEQEPVVKYYGEKLVKGSKVFALFDRDLAPDTLLYAAPVRTKDLTDDEIRFWIGRFPFLLNEESEKWVIGLTRIVIAADREKNK